MNKSEVEAEVGLLSLRTVQQRCGGSRDVYEEQHKT